MRRKSDDAWGLPHDEEERELMDPDTWDWDTAEVLEPAANPGVVVAARLAREELIRVERAARDEGVTLSEYMKQSALMRALHGARG